MKHPKPGGPRGLLQQQFAGPLNARHLCSTLSGSLKENLSWEQT
ncbi:MAG: hypothetical protein ACREYB_08970 [Casimicrobiaceae bacterium]